MGTKGTKTDVTPDAPATAPVSVATTIPAVGVVTSQPFFMQTLNVIAALMPEERIFSKESGTGTYETLFNAFDLTAAPVYNFYTPDELFNDKQGLGPRKLDEVPRYIIVSWERAPRLKVEDDSSDQKSVTKKTTEPVLFGGQAMKNRVFDVGGMSFTPSHLQPESFDVVKKSLANDHMAPGVIRATLELDTSHVGTMAGFSSGDELSGFDEQAFLNDPTLKGVSIQEYRAHLYTSALGLGTTRESLDEVSSTDKDNFVEGKFSFSSGNGTSKIQSVHPSSPSISLAAQTANSGVN